MDRLLEATARAEREHFWFHGFRQFVGPLLERAAGGRRNLVSLDCGCGTGHNLALLRRYGGAVGIDITLSGLLYAAARGDHAVARASAANLPFGSSTFDLVTSFDVIYSLPDEVEQAAMSEMFRVLRPGGHLILNVAALEMLRGNHSVLSGEVRRYSRRTLRRALERAGFVLERITYTNATLLPLMAATRGLQRLMGHKASAGEISVPPTPVNAALKGLLALESVALRFIDMPAGTSLLCTAIKPISGAAHVARST